MFPVVTEESGHGCDTVSLICVHSVVVQQPHTVGLHIFRV